MPIAFPFISAGSSRARPAAVCHLALVLGASAPRPPLEAPGQCRAAVSWWEHLEFCRPSAGGRRGHRVRKGGPSEPPGDGKTGKGVRSGVASCFLLAWPRHAWWFLWWLSHEAMVSPTHAPRLALGGGAAPNSRLDTQLLAFPVQGTPPLTLCCWRLRTSLPGLDTPWHGCLAGDTSPGPCSRQDELRSRSCPELPVGPAEAKTAWSCPFTWFFLFSHPRSSQGCPSVINHPPGALTPLCRPRTPLPGYKRPQDPHPGSLPDERVRHGGDPALPPCPGLCECGGHPVTPGGTRRLAG